MNGGECAAAEQMKNHAPTARRCAGGAAGGLIKLVVIVALGFVFVGPLLRCAQQLPAMAGHAAGQAADEAASGIGHAVSTGVSNTARAAKSSLSRAWDTFKDWVEGLFHSAQGYWTQLSPADKLKLVCENLPVEGLDHVCPYFVAPVGAATEAEAARIHCYLSAAATTPNGAKALQEVTNSCSGSQGDPDKWERCLSSAVVEAGGDVSSCLGPSLTQFAAQVRASVKPIACPPGTPESWCTTQQSTPPAAQSQNNAVWDNGNALRCLGAYRMGDRMYPGDGCGGLNGTTSTQNAQCVASAIASWSKLGAEQVAYCKAQPGS